MNFYNTNPMAEMALPTEDGPVVRLVEFGRMLDHAMYRRIRRKFYRLHCQFISGNDKRAPYDYFMLVCGPVSAKSQTLAADGAVSMIGEDGSRIRAPPAWSEPPTDPARRNWFKMTPAFSKFAFIMLAIGWYAIRYEYARRSRREKVLRSNRGAWETALLLISLTGLGILPFAYVATGIPRFAAYTFHPIQAWLGLLVAIAALVMFHLTHRALGRNWSISLDVREDHQLVTDGIYRRVRHPMYSAFWLWAIAQALLLPNWVAGFLAWSALGFCFLAASPGKSDDVGSFRR